MKVPITLNIEQTQLAVLKRWSQESGAPVSELIRRAISKALDEQNKREKKDKRN
ncbi:MAG: ribbon-helix-helix domain-containing protein [Terriglobales bacterium]